MNELFMRLIAACVVVAASAAIDAHGIACATEKDTVAAIIDGRQPSGVDADCAAAIQRLKTVGGRFEFDDDGQLVGVDLASDRVSVTPAEVRLAASMPHLTRLRLSGAAIDATSIALLGKLARLTDLLLLDVPIDDEGVRQLSQLPNLQSLTIRRSPKLTDACTKYFGTCPKLARLGLLDVNITDQGVADLANLQNLRLLDLRGCQEVGDTSLKSLGRLKQLKAIRLSGNQVSDESLAILKTFPALVDVTVQDAAVTDEGIAHLANLKLQSLFIDHCLEVTDEAFQRFRPFKELRQLTFRNVPIDGTGLKYLDGNLSLTSLRLLGANIDDSTVKHLAGLKNLRRLELPRSPLTEASVETIGGLRQLEYLDVTQTAISTDGVHRLANMLPKCTIAPSRAGSK